ncbi:MAG: phosphoribosylamine--glycine ligase [Cetobacterium sp.]|uniref:phosphoribosylamine--glycine ligase n=1 Tax=unclassified Cetobacterium TaxID=2630983 RepID=UPI00163B6AA2|nr:phosphoribosylamine--glycine ligase [Cetobacterium sp. 2A]MBC2856032.1 phosphoribosylamine--glycine ligase [Cetobacterium sp. 2A]
MKILIVGKGGREHALAWKVKESEMVAKVFVAPGNPGMKSVATLVDIKDSDVFELANFAEKENIDLTIVGPETSLALGIADEFEKRGLKIFGPKQAAAKIESSKDFAKKIMAKYEIPTAEYKTFYDFESAKDYVITQNIPIVIKEDGLKAGKGVTVATTLEEAISALNIAFDIPDNKVVIEECLEGFEFSIIALVNGEDVVPLEVAQDHKRVFDGDKGPNTGGMGIYSPVSKIDSDIMNETMEKIMKPMAKAMVSEGIPFKGFLFGGIMLTDSGVKTIEFNARFGDPEAEGILPRMKTDLVDTILKVMSGDKVEIEWDKRYTLGVVMASENYPESSTINAEVYIPEDMESLVFHMGTKEENNKLLTAGGRVISVVAFGDSLEEAKEKAYEDIKRIKSKKLFYRSDIGSKLCYNS